MKRILLNLALIGTQTLTYAHTPVPGVYMGAMLGVSSAPSVNQAYTIPSPITTDTIIGYTERRLPILEQPIYSTINPGIYPASIDYSWFGLISGSLGYRWENYRIEAQFFYNTNPYNAFNFTYQGTNYYVSANNSAGNYIQGQTNTSAGMFNLYYDFLPGGNVNSYFAPFLGVGGGIASVQNQIQVYLYNQETYNPPNYTRNSLGGQLMAGTLFFIDNFSFFSLDFRYFTTTKYTQNLSDSGTVTAQNQILSVNLSFNSSLSMG